MATALLLGLPTAAINPDDLVPMTLIPGTTEANRWQHGLYSQTAEMIQQRWRPDMAPVERHGVLSEADLKRLAAKTDSILGIPDLRDLSLLFLYATTFTTFQEHTAAFVFGWTVIERHVFETLLSMPLTRTRREKFSKFSVDTALEILLTTNQIPTSQYDLVMHLKDIRNRIVHQAQFVSRSETGICLEECTRILREMAQISSGDYIRLAPLLWP